MTATGPNASAPALAPYDELTQLRHAWVVFVLTRTAHSAIKEAVLEAAAEAGRRLPPPRRAMER